MHQTYSYYMKLARALTGLVPASAQKLPGWVNCYATQHALLSTASFVAESTCVRCTVWVLGFGRAQVQDWGFKWI